MYIYNIYTSVYVGIRANRFVLCCQSVYRCGFCCILTTASECLTRSMNAPSTGDKEGGMPCNAGTAALHGLTYPRSNHELVLSINSWFTRFHFLAGLWHCVRKFSKTVVTWDDSSFCSAKESAAAGHSSGWKNVTPLRHAEQLTKPFHKNLSKEKYPHMHHMQMITPSMGQWGDSNTLKWQILRSLFA